MGIKEFKEFITKTKLRVVAAGIIVSLIPILCLDIFAYFIFFEALKEKIYHENYTIAKMASAGLNLSVNNLVRYGEGRAAGPGLINAIKKGDERFARNVMKSIVTRSDEISGAFVATPEGLLWVDYPSDPKVKGVDFSYRDWYRGVSKSWEPYVSELYLRAAEPKYYLFAIALPIKDENNVIGILVLQPNMKTVFRILDVRFGKGFIYLVDKKGNLIYHPEKTIDRIINHSSAPAVQRVMKGDEGVDILYDPIENEEQLTAHVPVKGLGWGVIAQQPVKEAFAPVWGLTLLLASISGLLIFMSYLFARKGADLFFEIKEAEIKLQYQNEELQAQQKAIEETNIMLAEVSKAKSDFLANMSHELRTPLNSIIGFSEILEDRLFGPLNENQQGYVRDILESGNHLLTLINDILDVSKVEAGKMELELSNFLLKDVLNASLRLFEEKAMKHGINLSLDIAPEADIEIVADERKLKQILFNLISNAVKFTPAGGSVRITARHLSLVNGHLQTKDGKRISLPMTNDDELMTHRNFVEISVEDTGLGIAKEDIPRLFHEFVQLESPYQKKYTGTGLGLALTKKLVELHGGRIWVESELDKGSKFTFVIPV